jgi:predicted methyltransferase
VVELQAGKGYYSELLIERVGAQGAVWAQNNAFVMDRFARGPLTKRIDRIGASNLKALESELDAPKLPSELDAVLIVLFYHDTYWQGVDRAKMNLAVFEALKPGGVYGVVDHHAEAGSGDRDVKTLHRVDMELVKKEILEAGFVLDASSDLLANPDDARNDNVFKREPRDDTDRFVLRFRKPANP